VALLAPSGAPVFAVADARRFRQVLGNLLHNAITHTLAGGAVSVEVAPSSTEVVILVRDTGVGIPAEHLPLIWERFHRVDASRDRAAGGRGLGLAIVKHFVERMGGRVDAHSELGRGSTFEIRLPRSESISRA
jgi:signal transduction histidine kinase